MGSLYHPIFSQQLSSHRTKQDLGGRGSEGIQPRQSAGIGRSGFSWKGKERKANSCTAQERELLKRRYKCLGFKEYCLSCLNITAGVRWMCGGKLLLYVKIGEEGTWPFEY